MATIPTEHLCPTCKESGKNTRLSQNMLTGEFSCAKGHKFEEAQIVTAIEEVPEAKPILDEAPAAPPAQAAPAPPATPEEDFVPPPHLRVPGDKVLTASAPRPNLDVVVEAAGNAKAKVHFEAPAMVPAVLGRVPGNNMKVELVVAEMDWMSVCAEAEVQHQAPEVYLQERINQGFLNRWFFLVPLFIGLAHFISRVL
jgi:hypothetical protein